MKDFIKDSFTFKKDNDNNKTGNISNPTLISGLGSVLDKSLGYIANNLYYDNINPEMLNYYKAVYGDANQDPLLRLYNDLNGNIITNALHDLLNQAQGIYTGVSSNQGLLENYKGLTMYDNINKPNLGARVTDNFSAFGKGFTNGFTASGGNIWAALISGAAGGAANIFSQIKQGSNRKKLNNTITQSNNQKLFNADLAVHNSNKQNNYTNMRFNALGGYIDIPQTLLYDMLNRMLTNGYIDKMNNSKIFALPTTSKMYNVFDSGGNLSNMISINEGDSHELNPYGGVPMGIDSQGIMNTVEEGEKISILLDGSKYVWSNSEDMIIDKKLLDKYNLGKITYAKAIEKLHKERDERPSDPISKNGWNVIELEFKQSQENLRKTKELKKLKKLLKKQSSTDSSEVLQFNDGGLLEKFKYAPIAGNLIGLSQNLFTPEDYSLPNRLLQEVNVLSRVATPKFGSYMTYNPIDVNRYTNSYNALAAGQKNAIMNTSNPNKNAVLTAAIYNTNIGYGDLVQAIEAQNVKEKQAVLQFNAGIDQLNIANQLQVDGINQQYEQMRINGIMQELAMRDAIQTGRANAIQGNLKGLTDNMYNMYLDDVYNRQMDTWMQGQSIPINLGMQVADKSISPEVAKLLLVNSFGEKKAKEIMGTYTLDGKPLDLTKLFGE